MSSSSLGKKFQKSFAAKVSKIDLLCIDLISNFDCLVVVHNVVLTSAEDASPYTAGRIASALALDALEGDADFMTRTCDCRARIANTKKVRQVTSFEEALERALAAPDGYEPEGEDAQIGQ